MTAQPHQRCPTSDLWGFRHMVTDRRWTLATPDGVTITLCSAACTVSWLCHALPADLAADDLEPLTTSDTVLRRDAGNEAAA